MVNVAFVLWMVWLEYACTRSKQTSIHKIVHVYCVISHVANQINRQV